MNLSEVTGGFRALPTQLTRATCEGTPGRQRGSRGFQSLQ